MKWAKRDILRIPMEGEEFQASLSFTEEAIPRYMNIRRIESVDVKAKLSYDAHSEVLLVDVDVKGKMILPCSISFQDVPHSFKTSSRLAFSFTQTDIESDVIIVDGEELDFDPEILSLIWMEVPPRVISPKIKELPQGEGWEVVSEEEFRRRKEEKIDPRLAKILEYKAQDDEEV
ncbi:MAG TPA: hypothetical protein DIC19_04075 [Erysipelotrichaceae bacterium]|nr:hypothetical protein [Erysipelotrichaceae bacterium]